MTSAQHTTPGDDGRRPATKLGRGLERALANLKDIDAQLRVVDEHLARARAAERAAGVR